MNNFRTKNLIFIDPGNDNENILKVLKPVFNIDKYNRFFQHYDEIPDKTFDLLVSTLPTKAENAINYVYKLNNWLPYMQKVFILNTEDSRIIDYLQKLQYLCFFSSNLKEKFYLNNFVNTIKIISCRNLRSQLDFYGSTSNTCFWEWYPQEDVMFLNGDWDEILDYVPGTNKQVKTEEVINKIPEEDLEKMFEQHPGMREWKSGLDNMSFQHRFYNKKGEPKWYEVKTRVVERSPDGRINKLIGASYCIDPLKKLEDSLNQQKDQLELMVYASGIGFWEWDVQEDNFRGSPQFSKLLGYSDNKFENIKIQDLLVFVHPHDMKKVEQVIQKSTSEGNSKNHYSLEARLKHKNGNWKWFKASCLVTERNSRNQAKKFIGGLIDIDQHKQLERELNFIRLKLEDRLALMDLVYRKSPIGLALLDKELRFVLINEYLADINHLEVEKHLGKSVDEILPEEALNQTRPVLENVLKSGKPSINNLIIGDNPGEPEKIYYLNLSAYPILTAGNISNVGVVIQDVTMQYKIEASLIEQNQLLEDMGKMAKVGGWEVFKNDNRVLWTDEVARIYGTPIGQQPPLQDAINFYHPDYQPIITEAVTNCMEKGEPFDLELRFIDAQKNHKWVHALGKAAYNDNEIYKIFGTFQDITLRKNAELTLRESETRYRTLFEGNINPNLIIDEEGNCLNCNGSALELLKCNKEEILGKNINELIFELDKNTPISARKKLLAEGGTLETKLKVDNNTFILEFSLTPLEWKGKKVIYCIGRDITHKKMAEKKIKALNHALEEQNSRLKDLNEELNSFSYSVSHDLRAPLRVIDGFSTLILDECSSELTGDCREYIEHIVKNSNRMKLLIEDMLAFSRLGRKEIHKESINIKETINEIIQELRILEPHRQINFNILRLVPAFGDQILIKQVFHNILSNAVKFTRTREKSIISIDSWEQDNKCFFSITDNGVGFDMKHKNKIFEVFRRVHKESEFEGTGVGLAIVKRIVNRHGGEIWASSEKGKGATFSFYLPQTINSM
ncbi:MAG: PAS domain S-box protein [Vulcanimicrobiota bacterium]